VPNPGIIPKTLVHKAFEILKKFTSLLNKPMVLVILKNQADINRNNDQSNVFTNKPMSLSNKPLPTPRKLCHEYSELPQLQYIVIGLPWGHNVLLLEKIKDLPKREKERKGARRDFATQILP
jgi:hypothetical protein